MLLTVLMMKNFNNGNVLLVSDAISDVIDEDTLASSSITRPDQFFCDLTLEDFEIACPLISIKKSHKESTLSLLLTSDQIKILFSKSEIHSASVRNNKKAIINLGNCCKIISIGFVPADGAFHKIDLSISATVE
jgi:hypothetical protein